MNKSNEKLNLLKDISVFEYVADNQSKTERINFENALSKNESLRNDVAAEQEFRSLVEKAHLESPVSGNNIDRLFDRIDSQEKFESDNIIVLAKHSKYKPAMSFAIAASLVIAVFFSFNINNELLEPKFQTLTSGNQNDKSDLVTLSSQSRLIKIELNSETQIDAIPDLLTSYNLQRLSQSNTSSITAYSDHAMTNDSLALIQQDFRIKRVELVNLNTRAK